MYLLKYELCNKTFLMDLEIVNLEIVEGDKMILLVVKSGKLTNSFYVDSCSLYCNGNLILHKTMEDFK